METPPAPHTHTHAHTAADVGAARPAGVAGPATGLPHGFQS